MLRGYFVDIAGKKSDILISANINNKYNYINLDGSTSSNNDYDKDGNNLNLVNFNADYCINPKNYIKYKNTYKIGINSYNC
mgnify:CR=1 FL=1